MTRSYESAMMVAANGSTSDIVSETMQQELFSTVPQPAPDYRPDPAKIRAQLCDVLAQARAAPTMPWRVSDREFYRVVFAQMANWLPSDERRQLCFEFDTELARLEAA